MATLYKCAGCDKELPREEFHEYMDPWKYRPVTSKCRECRRNHRYDSTFETVCICCNKHRPLDTNNQCRKCNEEQGLRQCKVCHKLKPLFLEYYGRSKKCKECYKKHLESKEACSLPVEPLDSEEPLL